MSDLPATPEELRVQALLRLGPQVLTSLSVGSQLAARRLIRRGLAHVADGLVRRGPAPAVTRPPEPSRPPGGVPIRLGFYWARWCLATGEEAEQEFRDERPKGWEVVQVVTDWGAGPALVVNVTGIRADQPVEDFHWGPGPLAEPGA